MEKLDRPKQEQTSVNETSFRVYVGYAKVHKKSRSKAISEIGEFGISQLNPQDKQRYLNAAAEILDKPNNKDND